MALKNYGVLVGRVVDRRAETDRDSPHYQLLMTAAGTPYRVAVNVLSSEEPPNVLYAADDAFRHPALTAIAALEEGHHVLASRPGGAALDFIRANLVERDRMRALPPDKPGPDNDLADALEHYVQRAIGDPQARVYAFGERWGPEEGKKDKIFGFVPGNGIHDVHMNQGNSAPHARDDGVWQDGALLLHFPGQDQWVAVLLAFQSQSWHTDDRTGHALDVAPVDAGRGGRLRVVGALVDPVGPGPEAETVTLLNAGPEPLDLTGWRLADRVENATALPAVVLGPGETLRVSVTPPFALGNGGGIVTLLDPAGLKVDGVTYTRADVREGWSVTF
ncbi:DUF2278 family protein [Actinomycetospora aeridis]|uniref:DUF2278 family protein n=1 Tax=Actinomycetospora aeridis TaxID=3129231 RepID=A0ABU8N5Q2_9PSEU